MLPICLNDIDDYLATEIQKLSSYELISEINFSENDYEVLSKKLVDCFSNIEHFNRESLLRYKNCLTVFLVFSAKYYWNCGDGGFWPKLESVIQLNLSDQRKKVIISLFKEVVEDNDLAFVSGGLANLTPIIYHSGLPINLMDTFIKDMFWLTKQNIQFSDLGEEAIYACRNSTATIQTFIESLQEMDLLNEYVNDFVSYFNNSNGIFELIPEELKAKIDSYKDKNNRKFAYTSNNTFRCPTLRLDFESEKLFIDTFTTIFDRDYYDNVQWRIISSKGIEKNKTVFCTDKNHKYVFNGTSIEINSLEPFTMAICNQAGATIDSFDILSSKPNYLTFNKKGLCIKNRKTVSGKEYVLIQNKFVPQNNNILLEKGKINDYSIYLLLNDDVNSIIFMGDNEIIEIPVEKQCELISGEILFGGNATFDGLDAYAKLPEIALPVCGSWKISIETCNDKFAFEELIENGILSLSNYIHEYGKISIRLYNKNTRRRSFRFLYFNGVFAQYDSLYPTDKGYDKISVDFTTARDISILDSYGTPVKTINIIGDKNCFEGSIKYNDFNYPFVLNIRPFSWSLEKEFNCLINNKCDVVTSNTLLKGESILKFENNTANTVYLVINNYVSERKVFAIGPQSKRLISIHEYVEYIRDCEKMASVYLEKDFKKLFDLLIFKHDVAINNFRIAALDESEIIFKFDEIGNQINRAVKIRPLNNILESQLIPIKDEETMFSFKLDDFGQTDAILEIVSDIEEDVFSQFNLYELPNLNNSVVFVKDHDQDIEIETFDEYSLNNLKKACFLYVLIKTDKEWWNKKIGISSRKKIKNYLKNYLFEYRIINGDAPLLNELFSYELGCSIEDVINELKLYVPIIKSEVQLTRKVTANLFEHNKYLYLVYSFLKNDENEIARITDDIVGFFSSFNDTKELKNILSNQKLNELLNNDWFKESFERMKINGKSMDNVIIDTIIKFAVDFIKSSNLDDKEKIAWISTSIKEINQSFGKTIIQKLSMELNRRMQCH